jgi:hypothetical protein
MSAIQSHYEISVSRHGYGLFNTGESIVTRERFEALVAIFTEKFPESEGFKVSGSRIECSGHGIDLDAIVKKDNEMDAADLRGLPTKRVNK